MYRHITAALCVVTLFGCDANSVDNSNSVSDLQLNLIDPGLTLSRNAVTAGYVQIPGTIQAEDYIAQSGISIGQADDTGGSDFVGWIGNNDYTEYTINVLQAGTYKLNARVTSRNQDAQINFSVDGNAVGTASVESTGGWSNWTTVSSTLQLTSGEQKLRLEYTGGNSPGLMNINWFSLETSEIDSSNWTVSSNFNTDDAYRAIDGDDGSRWTTGARQADGQDFYIDMGNSESFDRIILDSSNSSGDEPQSYRVYVSNDNSNWSEVAAGTGTSNGITVIDFADQNNTYIKISQVGSKNRNWWSIHEVSVFTDSADEQTTTPLMPITPPTPITPIDGEILTHNFNDGDMYPFTPCTVKSPNYASVVNGRVKTYWVESSYDGSRTSKGAEFCDAARGEEEMRTRDEGAMGFTVNVDSGHSRNTNSALAQVFGFDNERDIFSWAGLLELQNGNLVAEHRYCKCTPTSTIIVDDLEYGVDHDIVIEFKVSDNYKGKFKVWVNGQLKYNATGINFGLGEFNSDDVQVETSYTTFKLGMYNHNNEGYEDNETRIVYYDDVTWYTGKDGYDVVSPR